MTIRSLQANVNVFFASNSMRRNVATHSLNYLSTSSEQRMIEKSLSDGDSLTVTNSETIVGFAMSCKYPVSVVITPRAGDEMILSVSKFLFLDMDFASAQIIASTDGTLLNIQIA